MYSLRLFLTICIVFFTTVTAIPMPSQVATAGLTPVIIKAKRDGMADLLSALHHVDSTAGLTAVPIDAKRSVATATAGHVDPATVTAAPAHVGPSDNFALAGTPWKRSGGAVGGGAWARAAADKFKAEPI